MNTKLIAGYTIFLHGLSGAGKSVLQKSLEEELSSAGFTPIYLSSGDCFRALSELDPELAKKMSQGNFIQTLVGTMPLLKKTINIFLESEKNILILDGFLRKGQFEIDEEIIPSQIDQVGDAFPLANAANEIVRKAWHLYVDVNDEDAEALMRIRSEKHLNEILKTVKNEKLKELIKKALQVNGSEQYRLKAVPKELHQELDQKMQNIINDIFKLANMEYIEGIALAKAIQAITGQKVTIRDDDLTFKRRLKRISEFNINTKNGILIEELGFNHDGKHILEEQHNRLKVIQNGPSRGITLEDLEKKCKKIAEEICRFTLE